ncbi:GPP34 family phosphoprotein [Ruania suaedae]|uniref:GOLPH3/VPS74 family protein n=1 Tax=Ruania suaedae TaxID=2897774 RepID=UPI001E5DAF03|nr:GPP34 family phosphoprotein [Ruania suaedae]UFU03310.1 GPP34 family phosphoprotein [Ruania suaedae]
MTERHEVPGPERATSEDAAAGEPTLAEDLLLLFQPDSGTIAGEGTLYYVLAGAVLADLGLAGQVRTGTGRLGSVTVAAVAEDPPTDRLFRASWEYVAERARGVQTVLAATGPTLREPLLARLVERGDVVRRSYKALGLFPATALKGGDNGRRDGLLAQVRAVLVDGVEPTPRLAALAALVYGSGTLPQFHRDIPWTSAVIARAEELKEGNWGAGAAAKAVTRTITATIVNNVVVAAAVLPRS